MNLSLLVRYSLLLSAVPSAAAESVRGRKLQEVAAAEPAAEIAGGRRYPWRSSKSGKGRKGDYTAPHEVHQYEQVKFEDEPEWDCRDRRIGGNVGCIECWNPRPKEEGEDALVVQVKAMYKRTDFNIRDEDLDPPRDHCIFPGRGTFWTCFNSNLVIEPDTAWLDSKVMIEGVEKGPFNDKKQWDADGNKVTDGSGDCLPGYISDLIGDFSDEVFI